jgi:hypothetical protein
MEFQVLFFSQTPSIIIPSEVKTVPVHAVRAYGGKGHTTQLIL